MCTLFSVANWTFLLPCLHLFHVTAPLPLCSQRCSFSNAAFGLPRFLLPPLSHRSARFLHKQHLPSTFSTYIVHVKYTYSQVTARTSCIRISTVHSHTISIPSLA